MISIDKMKQVVKDNALTHSQWDVLISILTVGMVVGFDRMTKVVFSNILQLGESIPVITNVFHFTLVYNTGIAFGLFKNQGIVFVIIPIIAIALLVYNIYYYQKMGELSRMYIIGFSLILGGAIGNLIDRMMFGHVIDFIDFQVWPVFNIADSAITVGAVIILWTCFPEKKRSNK